MQISSLNHAPLRHAYKRATSPKGRGYLPRKLKFKLLKIKFLVKAETSAFTRDFLSLFVYYSRLLRLFLFYSLFCVYLLEFRLPKRERT